MQKVGGESQTLVRNPESAGDGTRGTGGRLRGLNPSLAALITWVVCLPVAFAAATLGPATSRRVAPNPWAASANSVAGCSASTHNTENR